MDRILESYETIVVDNLLFLYDENFVSLQMHCS